MKTVVKYEGRGKICCLLLLAMTMAGGCTRNYYREHADKETYAILQEKEKDPRWRIGEFDVYPDPRARFTDFANWDHPYTPFDDIFTKRQSPHPQRITREDYKEGTGWRDFLDECDKTNRKADAERKKKLQQSEKVKELVRTDLQKLIGESGPVLPRVDPWKSYEYLNEVPRAVTEFGMTKETEEASRI